MIQISGFKRRVDAATKNLACEHFLFCCGDLRASLAMVDLKPLPEVDPCAATRLRQIVPPWRQVARAFSGSAGAWPRVASNRRQHTTKSVLLGSLRFGFRSFLLLLALGHHP